MLAFLTEKLGPETAARLNTRIEARLAQLRSGVKNKSKQQKKVLTNTLMPRIAMYEVLREENYPQEQIMQLMDDHMVVSAGLPMRKKYDLLDRLPFAYGVFKAAFTRIVAASDLWEADIDTGEKDAFRVTMRKCFWHDTFAEYGCPEICRFACRCDDITYSDLRHIGFTRTQTLGTGGTCCDFCFSKRK